MHPNQAQNLFFVDAMLGNIAKKLRLLGYDSKYFSDIDDKELINTAKKENRTIISKDEDLIRKSQKLGVKSIFVTKNNEIEQFLEIASQTDLKMTQIDGDTARCSKCNSPTEPVDKKSIKGKIPEKAYEINERFWRCKSCSQIYWEGTHIRNLQKFVDRINERL